MDKRVISDCRKTPSENNCSVTIAGREEEVIPLAVHHQVNDHSEKDTPELRRTIRETLEDEKMWSAV